MIDTSVLRKKLLNLAVRGLICEQQNSDTPVSSELEKYEPKMEIDLPEIPDEWRYCKFDDVLVNRDSERIPVSVADRKKLDKIYDYYGASGVIDKVDQFLFDDKLLLISEDGANLLSRSTPIAFLAEGKFWVNNHAHVLAATEHILLEYAELAINAMSLVPFVTGAAQPKLSQNMMNKIAIPVPPIEEQERIVEKIREAFRILSVIDELQMNYLADIEILKNKLIDAGIQGKLTEHLLEDGTAEELYLKIQSEKDKHIKEGKSKNEKELLEITEDEITFEIPKNWKWVRVGDLISKDVGGGTPSKAVPEYWNGGDIPWASVKDFAAAENGFLIDTIDHITQEGLDNSAANMVDENAIVICMRMGLGKIARVSKPMAINQDLRGIWLNSLAIQDYFVYFYSTLRIEGRGMTVSGIRKKELMNMPFPLPPIEEQKRIVEKIDELLSFV